MPDYGADGTMRPDTVEPGSPQKPVAGAHEASEPMVRCPSCGADVVLREGAYGVNEPSAGLACPSCGTVVAEAE